MLPTSPASLVDFRQFLIFLIPRAPPLDIFRLRLKCKKNAFLVFWDFQKTFSHKMLVLTPGTILDQSHLCAQVFWGENPTLMHGDFLAPGRLLESKYDFFKKSSLLKNSTKFIFPVSSDLTDTFLFWKIFSGCMFKASWARVCVWRKFSKILKKREISRKGPLLQKSKNFLFPVSLGCPETFLFWKIFSGSKFWVCWIRICVAVITNNCSSLGLLSSPSVQF